jgi:hypothetical protein
MPWGGAMGHFHFLAMHEQMKVDEVSEVLYCLKYKSSNVAAWRG